MFTVTAVLHGQFTAGSAHLQPHEHSADRIAHDQIIVRYWFAYFEVANISIGTGWSGGAIAPPLLEGNGDLKGVAYFSITLSPSL